MNSRRLIAIEAAISGYRTLHGDQYPFDDAGLLEAPIDEEQFWRELQNLLAAREDSPMPAWLTARPVSYAIGA